MCVCVWGGRSFPPTRGFACPLGLKFGAWRSEGTAEEGDPHRGLGRGTGPHGSVRKNRAWPPCGEILARFQTMSGLQTERSEKYPPPELKSWRAGGDPPVVSSRLCPQRKELCSAVFGPGAGSVRATKRRGLASFGPGLAEEAHGASSAFVTLVCLPGLASHPPSRPRIVPFPVLFSVCFLSPLSSSTPP